MLLRSLEPADVIVRAFAAVRTAVGGSFEFLLFVKEILFVHMVIVP